MCVCLKTGNVPHLLLRYTLREKAPKVLVIRDINLAEHKRICLNLARTIAGITSLTSCMLNLFEELESTSAPIHATETHDTGHIHCRTAGVGQSRRCNEKTKQCSCFDAISKQSGIRCRSSASFAFAAASF